MSKQLSLYSLIALLLLIGILFYRVVEPFLVILFVSVVLAVLVEPIKKWIKDKLNGRRRVAAAITTTLVLLVFILPICAVLLLAGGQMVTTGKLLMQWLEENQVAAENDTAARQDVASKTSEINEKDVEHDDTGDTSGVEQAMQQLDQTPIVRRAVGLYNGLPLPQQTQIKDAVSGAVTGFVADLYSKTTGLIGDIVRAGIGVFILTLAVYYYLADGREFMKEVRRLMPLEQGEEDELFDQFHAVCRGVVLGTVVAGFSQAVLAFLAFWVIGVEQLWLLTMLTMVCSFIPFVGAVGVWAPVAIALAMNGQWAAAIGLSVYGFFIISTADNLIRAHVIGGEASLHPLIALVSVLGAIQLIGLWGIFIGPMIAALFYSIAHLLRRRILAAQAIPVGG